MPKFLIHFLSKFKEYIVLTSLLVLSLFIMSLNKSSGVKSFKLFALSSFATVNSIVSGIESYFENKPYIENLEKQNAKLMLEVNKLREYALENDELKKTLSFKSGTKVNLIHARIVSRLVSKISGYFIISKGRNDSLEVGMPVIAPTGLVGIVYDITDNFASVRTFQNSLFSVTVKDERSNISGIMNWNGKDLIMKNVPTTYDVEVGDRIVVSELSTLIPPEIPVGIVENKTTTVSGLLSNIIVKPFTKLNTLKNVIILQTKVKSELDSLQNNLEGTLK